MRPASEIAWEIVVEPFRRDLEEKIAAVIEAERDRAARMEKVVEADTVTREESF